MLKKIIIGVVLNAIAVFIAVEFIPEVTAEGGIKFYIIAGLIIGLLNVFLKPILKLLSIPFVIVTAGLFLVIINAFILYLAQWIINTMEFKDVRFYFVGVGSYLIAAIIVGIINWAEHIIIRN